jgi:hypothetical protein
VHRLTRYPIALGDLNNGNAAVDAFHDGVITLLHNAQLHEHQPQPPPRDTSRAKQTRGRQCHPSFEAGVSPINRSRTRVRPSVWSHALSGPTRTLPNYPLMDQGATCGDANETPGYAGPHLPAGAASLAARGLAAVRARAAPAGGDSRAKALVLDGS